MSSRLLHIGVVEFTKTIAKDARECGEIPQLPRNCERRCLLTRRIKMFG